MAPLVSSADGAITSGRATVRTESRQTSSCCSAARARRGTNRRRCSRVAVCAMNVAHAPLEGLSPALGEALRADFPCLQQQVSGRCA